MMFYLSLYIYIYIYIYTVKAACLSTSHGRCRRSKNMSIHPIVVTYDEGVANFKLHPLSRICTCIIKYQIYAILNFYYIVNCVY